jgi:hypothetical protein
MSCRVLEPVGFLLGNSRDGRLVGLLAVGQEGIQVMNEVALHRGQHRHLNVVDAYFDGQHLTEAVVCPVP